MKKNGFSWILILIYFDIALCRILKKILGSGNMSMMDHAISVASKNFFDKVCTILQSLALVIVNLLQDRNRSS